MSGAGDRFLLVVGATRADLDSLEGELPELAEVTVTRAAPGDPALAELAGRAGAAVVFAGNDAAPPAAWLSALPPSATLVVDAADSAAFPDGVEVLRAADRDRLVPAVARLLRRLAQRPVAPSIEFCERLLRATEPQELCQLLAVEIAYSTAASWAAVLQVSGEARAFEVAGSVGAVPSVLHDCHDMTPAELAGALGWNARQPFAQMAQADHSTVSLALTGDGSAVAFMTLQGAHTVHGVAVAGWLPPATPPPTATASLTALGDTAAAALRYAADVVDLRISERTKSEFVATMSHELRNPLSAILGYTDLLAHGDFGKLGEEQAEVLRRAHQSASSLLDLINATLDVSRLEVGGAADQTIEVDLYDALREEIDEISRGRRQAQVRILRAEESPVAIFGDPLKMRVSLRQALEAALTANAGAPLRAELLRHEPGCAIEIAAEAVTTTTGRTPVVVEVPEDTETQGVPFAVFVAKRLLDLIGASLTVWREQDGNHITFRLWIPDRPTDRVPA